MKKPLKIKTHILPTSIGGNRGAQVIAVHDATLAGTVTVSYLNSKTAHITNLFVKLGCRNSHVAKRMLDECCALAQKHSCKTVGLLVQPTNPAQFFYPKVGFLFAYEYADKSMLFVKRIGDS